MKRLSPAAIALFLLIAPSAGFAGYVADIRPIGFSKDGKVFAYEEFFVEPENGNAFSNIVFLDTDKNTLLKGSPITGAAGNIDDIRSARAESAAKALKLIRKYNLEGDPGHLVAFAPVTELNATANSLRYNAFPTLPPVGDSYTLTLKKVTLPVSDICRDQELDTVGFRLVLTEMNGTASALKAYEDMQANEERNCPSDYRLGGIVTTNFHQTLQVALVQVISRGFDGNNVHWLAIPFKVQAIP